MANDFDQYYEATEPGRRERAYAWATAIGLQDAENPKLTCHFKYKNILGGCFEFRRVVGLLAWQEGEEANTVLNQQLDRLSSSDLKITPIVNEIAQATYMTFWPTFNKCANNFLGGETGSSLSFEMSQIMNREAVTFRTITRHEYEALNFSVRQELK